VTIYNHKNLITKERQDVSLYPQTLQVWDTKDLLAFFTKRGKSFETCFFLL